jgi:hypothetical protein
VLTIAERRVEALPAVYEALALFDRKGNSASAAARRQALLRAGRLTRRGAL